MSDDKDALISWMPDQGSGWEETLNFLCRELKASKTSADARARFFAGYRTTCKRVAFRILAGWKWKGDIGRDAEDIASESLEILLGQEARTAGIFASRAMGAAELRGYLTRTIWRSCLQIAMRMRPREVLLSLDRMIEEGWEPGDFPSRTQQELRAEISEILAALESIQGQFRKIPKGMSLVDLLLCTEFEDTPLKGIKKRTLQRYLSQIRHFLSRQLDGRNDLD